MVSKLLSLLMDWETFNQLLALEQFRGVIKALQTSMMVLLTKVLSSVSLKASTILAKYLSTHLWQSLFLVKYHAFSIFL